MSLRILEFTQNLDETEKKKNRVKGKYTHGFIYPMLITVHMTSDLKEFIFIVSKTITLYLKCI